MVVVGGGELAAGAVVKRQNRVEVGLQVVDLVLETVAPDLESDSLAFRQLEGVPVDVFGLADATRNDRRGESTCVPTRADRWRCRRRRSR